MRLQTLKILNTYNTSCVYILLQGTRYIEERLKVTNDGQWGVIFPKILTKFSIFRKHSGIRYHNKILQCVSEMRSILQTRLSVFKLSAWVLLYFLKCRLIIWVFPFRKMWYGFFHNVFHVYNKTWILQQKLGFLEAVKGRSHAVAPTKVCDYSVMGGLRH